MKILNQRENQMKKQVKKQMKKQYMPCCDCLWFNSSVGSGWPWSSYHCEIYSDERENGLDRILRRCGRRRVCRYTWNGNHGGKSLDIRRSGIFTIGYGKYIFESEIFTGMTQISRFFTQHPQNFSIIPHLRMETAMCG